MLQKDKVVLRNVVIAMVAGSLGAVVIGTSCLGRHPIAVPTEQVTATTRPGTTADNAGGVQAEPVGTTNITSTTIVVNPASSQPSTQPSTSEPEPNQTPAPASTTVITQTPGNPPTVQVAPAASAPPAKEIPTEEAPPPPPPPPEEQPDAAVDVEAVAPLLIPVPVPPIETPSSGNVPSNPGIGSPQQPLPGQYAPPAVTPGNPYPNNPPSNLGQTRLPQGSLQRAPTTPPL